MLKLSRLLSSLLLLLAARVGAGDSPTALPELGELHRSLQRPMVTATVPAPASLQVGRAEVKPSPGARLLLLTAGGQPCGWVLDDPATLVYRVVDRFSIPIARRNLKLVSRLAGREEDDALVITTPISGAAVWGWGLEIQSSDSRPAAQGALPPWLGEILDEQLGDNPARDVLQSAYNRDAGYRWATFRAPGADLVLDVDDRASVRTEQLAQFRKIPPNSGPYSGRATTETLAAQPTRGAWSDSRADEFATTRTTLQVANSEGDHLSVRTGLEVRALREELRLLSFSLTRDTYDDRLRKRELRVSRVTVDGQPAPFAHLDFGTLLVALPRPLRRDQTAVVEVVADGDILVRPAGDNYWRLGNGSWYPRPTEGIGREWSSFHVEAEVRAPFIPFAPGTIAAREATATGNRIVTDLAGPMGFVFLLAGKYATVDEEQDGRRIHVSTYAKVKEVEARKVAMIAGSVRGCLEKWLGVDYPFADLQLIEVNQWGWGQAPPGFVFITQEAFLNVAQARSDDAAGDFAAAMTRGINERIAHEVAHGWFPHVAKVVRGEENWLSESLADYASALCLSGTDKRQTKHYWERQVRDWKTYAKRAGEDTSIYLAPYVEDGERDLNTYLYLLYGKGPLVLHALRQELARQAGDAESGDRMFMTWIRSYIKSFTYKTGETRHLIAILDQITGKPWQPWFERYVYGTETPQVD